jgi:microcystin-dependent protein
VGWALCNGQQLAIASYSALFALLGTTFGGDGVRTFNLPDLQGRVPLNVGNGAGLPSYVWGEAGGAANVTLLTSNLPMHAHSIAPPVSNANGTTSSPVNAYPAVNVTTVSVRGETATTLSYVPTPVPGQSEAVYQSGITGSNLPVSVEPPFLAVYFIIATTGIFPTRG